MEAILQKLPSLIDKIFTSPLLRCATLSQKLSMHYQLPIEKDNRLMEMNFGDWEIKKWDVIDQRDLIAWMNDYLRGTCPGGESYQDVKSRLKRFMSERLRDEYSYMTVTHGGIIKCFHGILNNSYGMDLRIDYGQIYHFTGILSV